MAFLRIVMFLLLVCNFVSLFVTPSFHGCYTKFGIYGSNVFVTGVFPTGNVFVTGAVPVLLLVIFFYASFCVHPSEEIIWSTRRHFHFLISRSTIVFPSFAYSISGCISLKSPSMIGDINKSQFFYKTNQTPSELRPAYPLFLSLIIGINYLSLVSYFFTFLINSPLPIKLYEDKKFFSF